MTTEDVRQQWRGWVEKNIGGSPSRIDAVMRGVVAAIDQRRTTDEVVIAARREADDWDRGGMSPPPPYESLGDSNKGIYDVVAADKSELGRATLAALNAVNLQRTLRGKAFFSARQFRGRYGFEGGAFHLSFSTVLLVLLGLSLIAASRLPIGGYPALIIFLLLVLRIFFVLIATPILAHRAKVDISNGRLMITYGLFSTRQSVSELHWIREVGWKQSFLQKFLNEATLWIHLDTPSRGVTSLFIPGLVPVSEIQNFVDKLRNVAQKIRQGNYYLKGFVN